VSARRRMLGAFYTPGDIADEMVRLLDVGPDDTVLDPAAGDGALVAALLRAGVAPERITAWDVDADACATLRALHPDITVEQRDTLLQTDLDDARRPRWDKVVANPPYLNKASAYVRTHRDALRRRFAAHVSAGETYAMFLHVALELVAPGGTVVFITSDTIRTLGTHERLRRRILDRHHLGAIVATPDGIFADASVATVILEIRDRPGTTTRVVRPDGTARSIPTSTFGRVDGAPFVLSAPPSVVALFDQPLRLSDLVQGHIGMHTRDNRRRVAALAGSATARRYARRQRDGVPAVITADEARTRHWRPYLKEGGDKDFHHPVVEYLDWRPEARQGYVIPNGDLFGREGLCVSGVSRRLSVREMPTGCHWDSNKVIGLVPHRSGDRSLLIGLLNSDLYTFIAKQLLNDSSSMQLRDLWKLPVPEIAPTWRERIAAIADEAIARRRGDPRADVADIGRRLDAAVYDAVGITTDDRAEVEEELQRAGRQRRS
jgi:hypothetical protein